MSDLQQPPAQPHGTPDALPQGTPPAWAGQPFPASHVSIPAAPAGASTPFPAPAPPASSLSGAPGRLAFVVALAALAIGLLTTLAFPLIVRTIDDTSAIGLLAGVANGLVLIAAVVALIIGLIAVKRPGAQVLAGIAIGIAAAEILGILVSWMSNLLFALSY